MFEKRKAYIEFLGKACVRIVTPYREKTFDLTEGCTIDLISLKLDNNIFKEISGFFASFIYDDEEQKWDCSVHMRISEDEVEEIGECDFKNNKQTFSGSVWVEK